MPKELELIDPSRHGGHPIFNQIKFEWDDLKMSQIRKNIVVAMPGCIQKIEMPCEQK